MKKRKEYQPKTGQTCGCRKGVQRDNCPSCEGTGMMVDFKAIRETTPRPAAPDVSASEHTPTPWRADGFSIYHRERKPLAQMDTDYLADCSNDPARSMDSEISQKEAIANAAFIVRAVNAHEELLKVSRALVRYAWSEHPNDMGLKLRAIVNAAQDAIAQAECVDTSDTRGK